MNTSLKNNNHESSEIPFVSLSNVPSISLAPAVSSSVWIFQWEMQILRHSESSILIILEFMHRKMKVFNQDIILLLWHVLWAVLNRGK